MTGEQLLDSATRSWTETKRRVCERDGGPHDFAMQVHLHFASGRVRVGMIPFGREDIPAVISTLAEGEGSEPAFVVVEAEAYTRRYARGEKVNAARGSIAAAWANGERDVTERLVVVVIDAQSGQCWANRVPYHYDDAGQPVFGAVEHTGTVGGGVVDLVRTSLSLLARST